ncbi:MAG: hypothetical protein Ct9H90mP16_08320 [Candidatus Poseidoniales archaeon]|nr:MAG: hypothetical protein Ct9H90mP16_08320 [Candidatus Poseidoniales archaeon]
MGSREGTEVGRPLVDEIDRRDEANVTSSTNWAACENP